MEQSKRERVRQLLEANGQVAVGGPDMVRAGLRHGPASFGQRAIWFAHQDAQSGAYNILSGFRVVGPFDSALLQLAMDQVIERHEVLRSSLSVGADGDVYQKVHAQVRFVPELVDLTALAPNRANERVQAFLKQEANHVFDLAQPPLARLSVFRLGDEEHILVANLHHIVSDGWSQRLLLQEVAEGYTAAMEGRAARLPALVVQYLDYGQWERQLLASAAGQAQRAFWGAALANVAPHGLPMNCSRADARGAPGARRVDRLDERCRVALAEAAREHRMTPFTILLTLFGALLARFSGEDDIVVGYANAQRQRPEVQAMIGYFVAGLPVRFGFEDDPSFRDLAQRTRQFMRQAGEHQDIPLELLVDELGILREPDVHPLFQIFISHHRNEQLEMGLGRAHLRPLEGGWIAARAAKFELALAIQEDDRGIELAWEWNSRLFDDSLTAALSAAFQTLLLEALGDPEQPLSALPLASVPPTIAVGAVLPVPSLSFARMFAARVVTCPDASALRDGELHQRYAELDRCAASLATTLAAAGVLPGQRVALPMRRSAAAVAAILALGRLGATFVPIDPYAPSARMREIVQHAGAVLALSESGRPLPELGLLPLMQVDITALAEANTGATPIPATGPCDPDQVAYIVFTSGSTGTPKGVMLSHGNLAQFLTSMQAAFDFQPGMRFSQAINLSTDMGLQNIFCALAFGGTLDILSDDAATDPRHFAEHARRFPCDVAVYTPSHFLALYQPELFATPLPRRTLLLEGEALPPATLATLRRHGATCTVANAYGPTETNVCSMHLVDGSESGDRVPIGQPLPNVTLRVVNRRGLPQPFGALGELWVEGPGVAHGYCGLDYASGGFALVGGARSYRTGDLVRLRSDGSFEFFGRRDGQVKIRGYRVELGEIESQLHGHPDVADAALRFIADGEGDGLLCAFVVAAGELQLDPAVLQSYLSQRLPAHMVPDRVLTLAAIPRLPNGKINVRALPDPAPLLLVRAFAAPQGATEQALAVVWAQALKHDLIGRDANFFALGGNSIKAIRLVALARSQGLTLDTALLNSSPLLADLAAALDARAEPRVQRVEVADEQAFALVGGERAGFADDIVDAYPLSSLQQAMVAGYLLGGERIKYLIVRSQVMRGKLDVDAIRTALGMLMQAYPVLRSSMQPVGQHGALQLIHSEVAAPLELHDLGGLTASERQRHIDACIARYRRDGLPLERAPMFALDLFAGDDEQHTLVWTIHHALLDGWSIARLVEQVGELSERIGRGERPETPRPSFSFRRLIELEQRAQADPANAAFWSTYLASASVCTLPRLYDAGASAANAVPIKRYVIDPVIASRLRHRAQELGVPLKTFYFAAYARVIGALCGEATLMTGYCSHGREEVLGAELVPGMYVCTLPVLVEHRAPTWKTLIASAQAAENTVWAQRFMPLADILRLGGKGALFEHFFNFVDFHSAGEDVTGMGGDGVPDPDFLYNLNEFVLTTNVVLGNSDRHSQLYLSFDPQVLGVAQVDAYGELFLAAMQALAEDDLDLAPDPLLTAALRERVLSQWNATDRPLETGELIHAGFLRQAAARPDVVAVIDSEASLSYGELLRLSRALCADIRECGVVAGQRIGVMLPRSRSQVVALMAVMLAGCAYVPLDPEWPSARRDGMLAQADAVLLLAGPHATPHTWEGGPVLALDLAELACAADTPADLTGNGATPDDLAYIIFTSGSTGQPKGVAMQHRAVMTTLLDINDFCHVTPDDRVLSVAALSFDLSVYDIFGVLAAGASLVLPAQRDGVDPDEWIALCERHRVTLWNSVPMAAQLLVERCAQGIAAPSALRCILLSGDRIPPTLAPALARCFPQARCWGLGGATEAAIWSFAYPILADTGSWGGVPYGRPLARQRAYLLDERDVPVLPGVAGQLHIAGEGLAQGYYGDPALSAAAFFTHAELGQRLYRTGDMGRYLPDGNIEFLGRRDFQVKIRGYRIELGEIEVCLGRHGSVRQAVVAVGDNAQLGRHLVAYVVPQIGAPAPDFEELRAFARQHLPVYMVPQAFMPLNEVPLSPNGKLDRRLLPLPDAGCYVHSERVEPRSALESKLATAWEQILGHMPGVEDNFFALGGDSIMALRLLSECARGGHVLSLQAFYQAPTVAGMATCLQQAVATAPQAAAPAGALQQLLPMQAAFLSGQGESARHHFNQALMLALPQCVDSGLLAQCLRAVARRHDVFRLRYMLGGAGWQAKYAAPDVELLGFESVALDSIAPAQQAAKRLELAQRTQRSIDIGSGPLLRAVHWHGGADGDRLLVVAHHLAVDAVSWQVLLGDLESAYAQAAGGSEPDLPSVRGSLQQLGDYLHDANGAQRWSAQLGYWLDQLRPDGTLALPQASAAAGRQADLGTDALLVPRWGLMLAAGAARGLDGRALLLSALYLALRQWSGQERHAILVEGHGRRMSELGPDATDVVGWLTAMYPLALHASGAGAGAILEHIGALLGAIPDEGIGYGVLRHLAGNRALWMMPEPVVALNYFGEFAVSDHAARNFRLCGDPSGDSADPAAPAALLLGLTAAGDRHQLRLGIEADRSRLDPAALQALLSALAAAFAELDTELGTAPPSPTTSPPTSPMRFRATPTQQGILQHSLIEAGSATYVNQLCLRLGGGLDEVRLRAAWLAMCARHEVLRAHFAWEEEFLYLQVEPAPHLPWSSADLRTLDGPAREQELVRLRREQRGIPFDPAAAPLMRVLWVRTGDYTGELVWTYHHALIDGWSLPIVLTELMALYEVDGRSAPLASPLPYSRYASWLADQDWNSARAYWKALLARQEQPLRIELGAAVPGASGVETLACVLEAELAAQLKARARALQVTVNSLFQAAWAYLLHRYSGQDEVVFGATHAGRPLDLPHCDRMVGLFINTVPVLARMDQDASIGDLARQLFSQQAEGSSHAHLPLAEIQAAAASGGASLFDTVVVFENYELPNFQAAGDRLGLAIEGVQSEEGTHYALTMVVMATARPQVRLSFRRDRYSSEEGARLFSHLLRILASLAAQPELCMRDVPLLGPDEMAQLASWQQMTVAPSPPHGLARQFADVALRFPDASAVSHGNETYSYAELERRADTLASALITHGAAGGRVALSLPRGLELVASILAIVKAGASYVPVDPTLPTQRQLFILGDSGCCLLLTSAALAKLDAGKLPRLFVEDCRDTGEARPNPECRSEEAYLIYTSGTTGTPKGVPVQQAQVQRLLDVTAPQFGFGPHDVWTLLHSYAFDFSVWEMWGALLHGGHLLVAPHELTREPAALLDFIVERGVTVLNQTPSAFSALVAADAQGAARALRLRLVIFGGEALDYMSLRPWQLRYGLDSPRLVNMYGITEITVHATWHTVEESDLHPNTRRIGRALSDLNLRVLDPQGRDVPLGVPGEIHVAGAGVAVGYHDRAELSAQRFVMLASAHGVQRYYRSGDQGRYRADGGLDYLGRLDRQVKLRGFRIELGEVEAALGALDEVAKAVVMCRQRGGDALLIAYVVPAVWPGHDDADSERAEATLVAHLRRALAFSLPEYMQLGPIQLLRSVPLTANGKVDHAALPQIEQSAGYRRAPAGAMECWVSAVWSEVLGCPVGDAEASFFELGGHSLKLGQVISRIRARYGDTVSFGALYQTPTVAAQAALLTGHTSAEVAPVASVGAARRAAGVPLTSAQQRIWYLSQDRRHSVAYNVPILLELVGELVPAKALAALAVLVRRHEALRTVFSLHGEQPLQMVLDAPALDFSLQQAADEAEADMLAEQLVSRCFDLERDIPFRACLIQLAPGRFRLAVCIHHIVCDAWSVGLLLEDFCAAYVDERSDEVQQVLALQLGDAAAWLAEPAQRAQEEQQLRYWKRQLAGHAGILELATDAMRPAQQQFAGGALPMAWPRSLSDALKAAAARHETTGFVLLTAAYALLMHRLSGSTDILVGAAYGMRVRPEFERVVGFFANSLPVRVRIDAAATVGSYLEQVRDTVGAAFAHGNVPIDRIIDAMTLERPRDRMPLFQVMMTLQNVDTGRAVRLPGIAIRKLPLVRRSAKFDLTWSLAESEQGLRGELEYDSALFEADSVQRQIDCLQSVLAQLVSAPESVIGELSWSGASAADVSEPASLGAGIEFLSLDAIEAELARLQGTSL